MTAADDLGATTVLRVHAKPTVGGTDGVGRTVGIDPGTAPASPVTVEYSYTDGELGALDEAGLALYVSADGGATWAQTDGTLTPASNEVAVATTDGAARRWALAPALTSAAALTLAAEGWRMLAVPEATTVEGFLGGLWTQGYTGADDPAGDCTVFVFDETAGTFDGGWACATAATDPLAPGDGVMAFVFEDDDPATPEVDGGFPKTLPLPGAVVEPPFSAFGLTYTDGPSTPAYSEGWSLVGNPLRTAFDWDAVTISGGLTQAVYVYDPAYLGGDYRTWTRGTGGDLADGIVPAFQGFFVKAVADAPALTVPESAIATDPGVYGRTAAAPDPLRLELAVVEGEAERPVSVAFVAPAEGAALGLDALDAVRLTPTAWPRAVLSTESADGAPLALNAVPADAAGVVELPLAVAAEGFEPGPLTLSLSWTGALPDGWAAVLLDRQSGAATPLSPGGRYDFALDVAEAGGATRTARPGALGLAGPASRPAAEARTAGTTAGTTSDRFALRLGPAGAVSTDDAAPAAFGLDAPVPNPSPGPVRLRYALAEAGPARLAVYDAIGREVALLATGPRGAGTHEATLDAAALSPGVYVVRLSGPSGTAVRTLTVVR